MLITFDSIIYPLPVSALCNASALCATKLQTAPQKGLLKVHTIAKIKSSWRNTKKEELSEDLMRQGVRKAISRWLELPKK